MDTELLVSDYLGRLEAATALLPVYRRAELVAEVRDHIRAALAEAGRSDEVAVRNILERLGSPEEIVAGEAGNDAAPNASVGRPSKRGTVEIASLLFLGLAWPTLFLQVGIVPWLVMGVVGLVLAWVSSVWSTRQKLITTVIVVALYAAVFIVTTPVRYDFTPVNSPVVTSNE